MLPFFQYGHRKNYNKNSIPYLIAPSVAMYIIVTINYQVNHKYTLFCFTMCSDLVIYQDQTHQKFISFIFSIVVKMLSYE